MKKDMNLSEFREYLKRYGILKTKSIILQNQLKAIELDIDKNPNLYIEASGMKCSKLTDMPRGGGDGKNSIVETAVIQESALTVAKQEMKKLKSDILEIKLQLSQRESFFVILGTEQSFLLEKYMLQIPTQEITEEYRTKYNNGKFYSRSSMQGKINNLVQFVFRTYCSL